MWFLSLACCPPPPVYCSHACKHELSFHLHGPRGLGTCVLEREYWSSTAGTGTLPDHESPVFPYCCITRPGNSSSPRPPLWLRLCVSRAGGDGCSGVGVLGFFTMEGASKDGKLPAKARTPALSDNGASEGWPPPSFRGCQPASQTPIPSPAYLPRTSAHHLPSQPLCFPFGLLVPSSSRLPESLLTSQGWLVLFFLLVSYLPCQIPQLLGAIPSCISLSPVLLS